MYISVTPLSFDTVHGILNSLKKKQKMTHHTFCLRVKHNIKLNIN